jgi:hypothetical protein
MSSRRRRVSLRAQVAELERSYKSREAYAARMFKEPISDRHRHAARLFQWQQDCLFAALRSLSWLASHPAVLRGYIDFTAPMVRHGDDWTPPPETLNG